MKVLHINCVYPNSSTGKITSDIHNALKKEGYDSVVLYTRGKKRIYPDAIRVCTAFESKLNHAAANLIGLMYGGCFVQTSRIINTIKKEKPDIVHLQCINGYFVNIYRLVGFLNKSHIPTVITLHAEFMYTANCALSLGCEKWKTGCGSCPDPKKATGSYFFDRTKESFELMRRAFEGFCDRLTVIGVCDWLTKRAAQSPIMKNYNIKTIYNGIDTGIFCPADPQIIRKKLNIKDEERLILWVTSGFTKEKGMDYFFKLTQKLKTTEYRFAVAGADSPDDYNGDILFLGKIADREELAALYSAADVTVCCSRQESYPTVCLESQCCGTPVVAFDVGGVAETIYPGMGEVLPQGEVNMMAEAVEYWVQKKKECSSLSGECIRYFSLERMQKDYIELYKSVLENNNAEKSES